MTPAKREMFPRTFRDVELAIEVVAPRWLQESYDNCGLLVGYPTSHVTGVLVALDVNMAVLEEAKRLGDNLVVAHHPAIFSGIKKLTGGEKTSRIAMKALEWGIGIIAAHTNLDFAADGVSHMLGKRLGLATDSLRPMKPNRTRRYKVIAYVSPIQTDAIERIERQIRGGYQINSFDLGKTATFRPGENIPTPTARSPFSFSPHTQRVEILLEEEGLNPVLTHLREIHPSILPPIEVIPLREEDSNTGIGAQGVLCAPMEEMEFLQHVCNTLGVSTLRHSALRGKKVSTVALCSGSGRQFVEEMKTQGHLYDAYITADCKYHDFEGLDGEMLLVDVNHYDMELIAVDMLVDILEKDFTDSFEIHKSKDGVNPVKYYNSNQ